MAVDDLSLAIGQSDANVRRALEELESVVRRAETAGPAIQWLLTASAGEQLTMAQLAQLPHPGLRQVPGATNALQFMNPNAVAEALIAFCAKHPMLVDTPA